MAKNSEAVERCRLARSSISETAAETPGIGFALRDDLSALRKDVSVLSPTD